MPKETNKKPIPVIASFNKEGQIMPIYIQVEVAPIKLLEVTYCNQYVNYNLYKVTYVLHNFLMDAYLYYYFDKHVWMIEAL